MLELRELISFITRHKIKNIDVFVNDHPSEDTKYNTLYNLVHDQEVSTDIEAQMALYGKDKASKSSYSKLKNRLKTRLLNTLFFIDINQPQFSGIESAFISCTKNWMAIRLLLLKGARITAIRLAEHTLRICKKYEFTELTLFLAKELRFHYSLAHPNKRKYDKLDALISSTSRIMLAELLAEKYYTDIMNEFGQSQYTSKSKVLSSSIRYSNELSEEYSDINSYRFIRISYLLHIVRYQVNREFELAITVCNNAIELIESKPYSSEGAIFSFKLRLLSCYIQLRQFKKGEQVALHYSNRLETGSRDWFVIMLYYFLLSSHSAKYNECYKIVQTVVTNDKFTTLHSSLKELWYVNQAFVHFLIEIGVTSLNDNDKYNLYDFKLYKFLNEIPIYSQDKRGINIPILIVHILFLLQQHKYSAIIDRVDALNQYCHRYLRRDDTFRANCFIKMLLQIPKSNFNRIRSERYAQKYVEKLHSMPINVASQGVEVEIVPYENLWEMVLSLLK